MSGNPLNKFISSSLARSSTEGFFLPGEEGGKFTGPAESCGGGGKAGGGEIEGGSRVFFVSDGRYQACSCRGVGMFVFSAGCFPLPIFLISRTLGRDA